MEKPAGIASQRLEKGAKLSDVARQHAEEATYTKRLEEKLNALQEWVKKQSTLK